MAGRVRTNERCPVCNDAFQDIRHPLTNDTIDLMCPAHKTRPRRFYIDARSVGDVNGKVGRLFRDRDGRPFDSFLHAHRTLEVLRKEIDDRTFDSTKWSPEALQERTVKKEAERWVEVLTRDRSRTYSYHVERFFHLHITPSLGNMDVRDVRAVHIEGLYRQLQGKRLEPKSIQTILYCFRTFLNRLAKLDVIAKCPIFPEVKVPSKERGWIDRALQDRVLQHVRAGLRPMIEIMCETGIRPGEAVALKVKDLVNGGIFIERALGQFGEVKETKTGAKFHKPLSEGLFRRLEEICRGKFPEAWIFTTQAGTPWRGNRVSDYWREAAQKEQVNLPLYVAMRHSRVTQERETLQKEMLSRIRGVLEHASSKTTVTYYLRPTKEKVEK